MKTTIIVTLAAIGVAALSFMTFEHMVQGQPQTEKGQVQTAPLFLPGNPTEGFQLSLSMDKSVFTPREAILVTVSLKNITTGTRSLATTNPESDFNLSVEDKQGKKLPFTLYGKGMNDGATFGRYSVELKGGEQVQYLLQIDRLYDLTLDGSYSIEVVRKVPNLTGNNFSDVMSKKLNVRIVEPTPDDSKEGYVIPGKVLTNENP